MLSNSVINWYKTHKRNLPWRGIKDPYKIWLSEIILQQTRVEQGKAYYLKFIDRFPNVLSLAEASEEEVLKLWQGLGYYSRARNMHKSAKIISEQESFPSRYEDIVKLKGVGKYTAAAISSFCFNENKSVVDGNVYRVLSRYYGIRTPTNTLKGQKEFQLIADKILPKNNSGEHNQAMMEFGALHCTYRNPKCTTCPLKMSCHALNNNEIALLPVKSTKPKVKPIHIHYFVIQKDENVFIQKRSDKGLWGGLYEFPNLEFKNPKDPSEILQTFVDEYVVTASNINVSSKSIDFDHQLTHRKIKSHFWEVRLLNTTLKTKDALIQISNQHVFDFPVSRLTEKYLEFSSFLDN